MPNRACFGLVLAGYRPQGEGKDSGIAFVGNFQQWSALTMAAELKSGSVNIMEFQKLNFSGKNSAVENIVKEYG